MMLSSRKRQYYVEWVNGVLQRHKGQYLNVFKIVCNLNKRNQEDINRWLLFALARKVQSLELDFSRSSYHPYKMKNNYVLPDWFPEFISAGEAKLHGGECRFLRFDVKRLKSLLLKGVDVTGEAIDFFLVNCPFLERLEVVGSLKLVDLVISYPSLVLKYLKIKSCHDLEVLSISNFNLVSLDISSIRDLTLTDLPKLAELSISRDYGKITRSISQASSCFSHLEALKLYKCKWEDVTNLSDYSQFTKLKRLVINVGVWDDESLTMLIPVITSCPLLEEFVLTLNWFNPEQTGRTIREVERRDSSLKSKSLKVFEFCGYCGRVSDVELIMYVVENVVRLEKIIIDPHDIHLTRRLIPSRTWEYERLREIIPPHVHLLIR